MVLALHDPCAGEKPYKCSQCPAVFAYPRSLKRHELVHEGIRPYKCPQCEKCFFDPTSLRTHSRVHTDDRPYVCQICGNRFRQNEGLKVSHELIGYSWGGGGGTQSWLRGGGVLSHGWWLWAGGRGWRSVMTWTDWLSVDEWLKADWLSWNEGLILEG